MPLFCLHSESAHLDLAARPGQELDFGSHSFSHAGIHGGTSRQQGVGIQVLLDAYAL